VSKKISLLLLLWTVTCFPLLGNFAQIMSNTALTFKARALGFSALLIGSFTSAFMITRGLAAVVSGYISDKIKRRGVFAVMGFALNSFVALGYALSNTWTQLILFSFLNGIASGVLWPSVQTIVVELSPSSWRSSIMSIYFALGSLGSVLSYLAYSSFYAGNYFEAFLCASSILILMAFSATPLARRYTTIVEKKHVTEKIHVTEVALALTAMFLAGLIVSTRPLVLLYLRDVPRYSEELASSTMSIVTFISLILSLMIGFLADKTDWIIGSLIGFIIGILSLTGVYSHNYVVLAASLGILLGSFSAMYPLTRAVMGKVKAAHRGLLIGLVNLTGNIGAVVGPLILGHIYDVIGPYCLIQAYAVVLLTLIVMFTSVKLLRAVSFLREHFIKFSFKSF